MPNRAISEDLKRSNELEAKKIYRSIFYKDAPDIIKDRFMRASGRLEEKFNKLELEYYYRVIQTVDDLEALEIFCRYSKRLPILSLKFQLMVFLAETLPENQKFFLNNGSSFLKCLFFIIMSLLQTACKMMLGVYLFIRFKCCMM